MKYCQKCGNQLMDEAVICPKCGCPVVNAVSQQPTQPQQQYQQYQQPTQPQQQYQQQQTGQEVQGVSVLEDGEKPTLANAAAIFAILMPIVGIILGIIGCVKYKNDKLKRRCIIAIPVAVVVWVIVAVLMML